LSSILVIRGGAIGDFILTLPAIAALRQQFPQARLEVLGYPHIVQLAQAGGLVDRAQSIEARGLAGFFARNGELAEDLADYFSDFDLIVSYLYDPDHIFETNVRKCTAAQFIPGPHRPDEDAGIHATKVYLKPLERLAIFDANPVPRLNVGQASTLRSTATEDGSRLPHIREEANRLETCPTLAIHPGSGSERKNWPENKWSELLQHLVASSKLDFLLVGGEAEGDRLQRLAAVMPPDRTQVAQSLPLAHLAALLQGCAAFVGHDSGICHLAAAVGLPGLVLWGETIEEIWKPPSPRMVVLRHPKGLAALAVDQVLAEFLRLPAALTEV
jgi:heptosyltransferase-2